METTTTRARLGEILWAEHQRDQLEQAEAMMAFYDARPLRQAVCWALSLVWLSFGGQTVCPVGLLAALAVLLPQLPAWSFWRRLQFAGRRAWVLLAFAVVGLAFIRARIALAVPGGPAIGLGFSLVTGF